MKTRAKHSDTLFRFGDPGHLGTCRLRVYLLGFDRPGPCVSNAVESIAAAVVRDFSIDPFSTLYIEHLMAMPGGPEEFWAISFDRDDAGRLALPTWRPITRPAIEHVVGSSLAD